MRAEFKNYYGLKRYLTVVAQNNNHDINFDNLDGLSKIYAYLHKHKKRYYTISISPIGLNWLQIMILMNSKEYLI